MGSLKYKDNGLTKLLKEVKAFKEGKVILGIINDGPHGDSKNSIMEIATMNHFGFTYPNGVKIPPRPFLTNYTENYKAEIESIQEKCTQMVLDGRSAQYALTAMGELLLAGLRRQITKDKPFEPNSPVTIEAKGSETPLVSEGILIGWLNYRVEI